MLALFAPTRRGLLLALLWLAACSSSDELPSVLIGRWTTSDPRYAERYFSIDEDGLVLFGQSQGQVHGGPIRSVATTPLDGGRERCQIVYEDAEGVEYDLDVEYWTDGTALVFTASRRTRWRREGH